MTSFKIATWNVNSLRVRLQHVLTWLAERKPDVLALQEIKLVDDDFPLTAIQEAGYTAIFSGQKTYNGVAILIKQNHSENISRIIKDIPDLVDPQRRVLGVVIDDIRVLNLYVPNGESVTSEKYQYKLGWLKKLDAFLKNELKLYSKIMVVGDFNIAPEEIDVYDPTEWQGQVLCSQPERTAFKEILRGGFSDCFRIINSTEKAFSWWDYRLNAFKRNRGLRIDHILASQSLVASCEKCYVDRTPRTWERPSDHAPVIAEFSFV